MDRKLASIQIIANIAPIENADAIERADVLGWHCVVRKGDFKIGDLCIYCEIDSVLPDKPDFEFLRTRGFRIKTIKLRGQVSQGIVFPVSILCSSIDYKVGNDVTDLLGITKWEPKMAQQLVSLAKGYIPSFIPKTDEMRIQSVPDVLVRNRGVECYYTEKLDGTSMSVWIKDDQFSVASRRLELKEDEHNVYWAVARQLELEGKLRRLNRNIALQGELIGPGVQGNKYGLGDNHVYFFNAFDIDKQEYIPPHLFWSIIASLNLYSVPMLGIIYLDHTVDDLVNLSKGESLLKNIHLEAKNIQREGIVVRSVLERQDLEIGRLSFKVVNPEFLLKFEEREE